MIKQLEENMFSEINFIEDKTRKENGITFTPLSVVKFMFDNLNLSIDEFKNIKFLEPSCGKGIFVLYHIQSVLRSSSNLSDTDIINFINNIYAYDIQEQFIFDLKKDIISLVKDIKNNFSLLPELHAVLDKNIKHQNFLEKQNFDVKFDLIIGNPPYIRRHNLNQDTINILKGEEYKEIYSGLADLSLYFLYKSKKLLSKDGVASFITSNKFITAKYGKNIRARLYPFLNFYLDNYDNPFKDVQISTCIITFGSFESDSMNFNGKNIEKKEYPFLCGEEWNFNQPFVKKTGLTLKELGISISNGLVSGYSAAHILNKEEYLSLIKKDSSLKEIILPIITGRDLDLLNNRYHSNKYIIYANKSNFEKIEQSDFLKEHFKKYEEGLRNRSWYKNNSHLPYYSIQGNTQFNIGEFNFLTKRIGDFKFIRTPKHFLYMDSVYNLVYPHNIDPEKLLLLFDNEKIYVQLYNISNKIGNKIEIHKNKFERIVLDTDEISFIQKDKG